MTPEGTEPDFAVKAAKQVLDRKAFQAGATIFAEGQPGTSAYILLRGDATIFAGLGTTHQRELMKIKPGQMFGELALMAGAHRTASAHTENGCELLVISQDKLKKKLDDADPFVRYWIEYLSRRVIDLSATRDQSANEK